MGSDGQFYLDFYRGRALFKNGQLLEKCTNEAQIKGWKDAEREFNRQVEADALASQDDREEEYDQATAWMG